MRYKNFQQERENKNGLAILLIKKVKCFLIILEAFSFNFKTLYQMGNR
jgi:hypothetical protein